MSDVAGNLSGGSYPLQTWRNRVGSDVRKWAGSLPELHVTLGRDERSAGMTVTVWEPTEGEFASYRTLYAARWVSPIMSTQEAMEVAYRGLAAAIAELFDVRVDR
jgi:hypothetical protein